MHDHDSNSIIDNELNLTLDSRNHSFNVGIAKDFSHTMALWIGHLAFYSQINLSKKENIHDGLVWSYDTIASLSDYFPYFSKSQIETMINNSVKEGLVVKGNYNKTPYDRTVWYALTPKAYFYFQHLLEDKYIDLMYASISEKSEMEKGDFVNRFPKIQMTIPTTTPTTTKSTLKKNIKKKKMESLTIGEMEENNIHLLPVVLLEEWFSYRKKPITKRVWNKTNEVLTELNKIHNLTPVKAFEMMLEKQWQAIEVTYFDNLMRTKKVSKSSIDNNDMNYTLGDKSEFGF